MKLNDAIFWQQRIILLIVRLTERDPVRKQEERRKWHKGEASHKNDSFVII